MPGLQRSIEASLGNFIRCCRKSKIKRYGFLDRTGINEVPPLDEDLLVAQELMGGVCTFFFKGVGDGRWSTNQEAASTRLSRLPKKKKEMGPEMGGAHDVGYGVCKIWQ